jgi:hypothetical protein
VDTIGSQHGITAMCNNWRGLWPQWTNPNRVDGDVSTYKGIDKLERTLLILQQDHDAGGEAVAAEASPFSDADYS